MKNQFNIINSLLVLVIASMWILLYPMQYSKQVQPLPIIPQIEYAGSYQLYLSEMDGSIIVKDRDRFVGVIPYNQRDRLQKLIIQDNE